MKILHFKEIYFTDCKRDYYKSEYIILYDGEIFFRNIFAEKQDDKWFYRSLSDKPRWEWKGFCGSLRYIGNGDQKYCDDVLEQKFELCEKIYIREQKIKRILK